MLLRPLKTIHECRAVDQTLDVYVLEVPSGLASKAVETAVPNLKNVDTIHLRRFVKAELLPAHVRALFPTTKTRSARTPSPLSAADKLEELSLLPAKLQGQNNATKQSITKNESVPLFMIACPVSRISREKLAALLSSKIPSLPLYPEVHIIAVPAFAPTSYEKAAILSKTFWPTVYKSTNPFGPHPSIATRAQNEISLDVEVFMGLARDCGRMVNTAGLGERIGCVIAERDWHKKATLVAAAGDLRYSNREASMDDKEACPEANVLGHAVLRAIGMVSRKRLEAAVVERAQSDRPAIPTVNCATCSLADLTDYFHCDTCLDGTYNLCSDCYTSGTRCWEGKGHDLIRCTVEKPAQDETKAIATELSPPQTEANSNEKDFFMDLPLPNSPETHAYHGSHLKYGGYLCHNMEIYITHEPCIMCSQALLHSRFGRVIIGQRMPDTGALTSETDGESAGRGYGLWWRKELNWNALVYEVEGAKGEEGGSHVGPEVHV
ncbi:MAG: hypothetical protein Q9165_000153 [Trypethelium subeluteriae]